MTLAPDPIDGAFCEGAVRALRKRSAALRERARQGTALVEGSWVDVRSPEAALALRIADDLESVAAEIGDVS
jgi:hypothetical protein